MGVEKILLVDDEARIIDSIAFFLEKEGFETARATSGNEALSLAQNHSFDLALLDISMPEMDGFQVMENLFSMDPDIGIVMITGNATVDSAIKALKKGAWDYLRKPFEHTDLIKTVQNAIGRKRVVKENKQFSSLLKASEKRYRYMVNNSPDLIFILDSSGCFVFVNSEFERILSFSQEDLAGKPVTTIVHPNDMRCSEPLLCKEQSWAEQQYDLHLRFVTAHYRHDNPDLFDQVIYVNLKGTEMFLPGEDALKEDFAGVYCVARDITRRIRLEEQLRQSQKMEAIGTLAGGIAHDFNNILMGIQGYTSLVRSKLAPDSPEYKKLANVDEYVISGSEMTRQLLGFAQKTDKMVKLTNINYLMKMSASMFGRTKKEIVIRQNLKKDIWGVEVDEGQIKQVLLNLYVNAWQAMPSGGHIYIKTDNVVLSEKQCKELGLNTAGRYVKVSVVDTGVGMEQHILDRIFDPFFTTKGMGGGTGIGLATAYGIIRSHGGAFKVLSKKNEGSSFTFYLPARVNHSVQETIQVKETKAITGKGTILLVDDEPGMIEVCKEMLECLGYNVLSATSGEEALDFFKDDPKPTKPIDLVILDMVMPEMSGYETFERIRSVKPDTKVLIASGYSKKDEVIRLKEMGCADFIQKPFDIMKLSKKINSVFTLSPK